MKKTMMLLTLCFLECGPVALAGLASTEPRGLITIFREKGHGNNFLAGFEGIVKHHMDHAGAKAHWQFYIDGQKFVNITKNVFVTISLPSGRHDVRISRGEPDPLTVEVRTGERIYIRPAMNGKLTQFLQHYFLEEIPCPEAVAMGIDTKPIKPKNLSTLAAFHDVLPEQKFPSQCSGN